MRVGFWLVLSLILNAALAVGLYFEQHKPAPCPTSAEAPVIQTNTRVKTSVVVRRQTFTWQDVESEDYPTFISNLRKIGCPEATIRDIVISCINELYHLQRQSETVTSDSQWWVSDPDPALAQAASQKLRDIEEERRATLTKLLGPGWEPSDPIWRAQPAVAAIHFNGDILGALDFDLRNAVLEITSRSHQQIQDYIANERQSGRQPLPAEVSRLRLAARLELEKILTPEQLEEYLLRYSNTAKQLRDELRGFPSDPASFRSLFRTLDAFDQQPERFYLGPDPVLTQRRDMLRTQREAAIKEAIGAERYALYRENREPAIQHSSNTLADLGMPEDTTRAVQEINRVTKNELVRIRRDNTLTADEKAEALDEIRTEQQQAIKVLLGAEMYVRYLDAIK